ncbi:MAG: ComF family protein [Candidatus Azambacteria bacterium]|nr:ComF family protein [Candidatus Azambacteria bacterium]
MFKNFLLDFIFPRYCLGCEKELDSKHTSQICEICFGKIQLNIGTPCQKKTALKELFSAGQYKDPILREAIHLFKYQSIESLKEPLAKLMINYLTKELLTDKLKNSVLTPIPLTLKRKLTRGFNQSELLAEELGKFLNLPVINLLKRKKFNSPQAEIEDWQKRKENISGVFTLASDINFIGFGNLYNKVILVDDVSTSGATLEEAAKVLKQAGVEEIYGIVVARG